MKKPLEPGARGYYRWQKAVMTDETLRNIQAEGYFDIRVIAWAISLHGANGRGCFATEANIG
jgi:hypothetical protein